MSQIAIDIGNTKIKAGIFSGKELIHAEAWPGDAAGPLEYLLHTHHVSASIIASVRDYPAWMERELSKRGKVIGLTHQIPLPITIRYKTPLTLGTDRIALAAGAHAAYPDQNVLVIDAGTALTFDIVNSTGEYIGGAISPGMNMRFRALNEFTGKLPLVQPEIPGSITGKSTKESILSGVVFGMANEIDAAISGYKKMHPSLVVLLTGGDAAFFESILKSEIFASHNLLLSGLNEILLYNTMGD